MSIKCNQCNYATGYAHVLRQKKYKKEKMAEKNRPLAAVLDWVTQWLDSIKSFQSQMHRKLDQGIDCQSNTND